ncbi:hypothetical protein L6R46_00225 [Myxococcota bacterium]|nr:hypothetical protein [Myxococcota bacterium]
MIVEEVLDALDGAIAVFVVLGGGPEKHQIAHTFAVARQGEDGLYPVGRNPGLLHQPGDVLKLRVHGELL